MRVETGNVSLVVLDLDSGSVIQSITGCAQP